MSEQHTSDHIPRPVRRYFATENGVLEWEARPDVPLPEGVTGELTEAEYQQRLAELEADRARRIQEARDAERAQADADVAALVAAGIPEDVAMRMTGHPDAQYPAPEPVPETDPGGD